MIGKQTSSWIDGDSEVIQLGIVADKSRKPAARVQRFDSSDLESWGSYRERHFFYFLKNIDIAADVVDRSSIEDRQCAVSVPASLAVLPMEALVAIGIICIRCISIVVIARSTHSWDLKGNTRRCPTEVEHRRS